MKKSFISYMIFFLKCDLIFGDCTDIYGKSITSGIHFIPGPDICQLCVCDSTVPKWCKRVLCSPPQNCKTFVMGSSCCDYSCLDNTLSNNDTKDDMDGRIFITIFSCFAIISLLVFVFHKFCHRDIHNRHQTRQLNEDRRSIGFITGSLGYLNIPNGHNFEDHPLVHYPVFKQNTNYFPRGEAPPPYDEVIAGEREIQEIYQQRRNDSLNILNSSSQSRGLSSDSRIYDPRQQYMEQRSGESVNIFNTSQHRTIPVSVCLSQESSDIQQAHEGTSQSLKNTRASTFRNKILTSKNEEQPTIIGRSTFSNIRPTICQTPIKFEASHSNLHPLQHRTLPLSASLSSPLPSTSNCDERQTQFALFSSAVNISSSDGDESSEPLNKKSTEISRKKLTPLSVNELDLHSNKDKKLSSKEHLSILMPTEAGIKDKKEESSDSSGFIKDYHAECENCNLNVNGECDGTDEYFSEQETMTLQRKCHEDKNNDQAMKTSLTLPVNNSRIKKCSLKGRKSGRWTEKESPFKTMLEYVSSEEEETEHKTIKNNTEENK